MVNSIQDTARRSQNLQKYVGKGNLRLMRIVTLKQFSHSKKSKNLDVLMLH